MRHPKRSVRRRLSTATAIGAAAILALTSCGGSDPQQQSGQKFTGEYSGPPVELSYWNGFTGGDGPFMKKMVEEFNAKHENITVKPNTMQWADFYQRLPAAVTAGEGPDVGVMHLDQLATNAARNVIVPIDDLASSLNLSADDFSEEVWNAGVYKDKRYGIPLDVHSLAMYYNTEHFKKAGIKEPPTDAESFQQALKKLEEAGYENPFWMPGKWPGHLMFLSLLWQNGGDPYNGEAAKATFDSKAGVDALSWQTSMIENGHSPKDVAIDSQYVAFKNGKTSITWDGIWQINDLKASGMPFAAAPIPTIGSQDAVWANSHQFFIPRQASPDENKQTAAKVFIAWMSKNSAEWAGAGMIPARKSVRESGVLEGTIQEPIAKNIENMKFLPSIPGLGSVQAETMEVAVSNAMLGKKPPEKALSDAAKKATQLMEENEAQFGN